MTERDFRNVYKWEGYVFEDDYNELLEAYERRGERIEELERELQRERTISASWKKLFTKCSKRELKKLEDSV